MLTYYLVPHLPERLLLSPGFFIHAPQKVPIKLLKRTRINPFRLIFSLLIRKPSIRSVEARTSHSSKAGMILRPLFVLWNKTRLAANDEKHTINAAEMEIHWLPSFILPISKSAIKLSKNADASQISSTPTSLFVLPFSILIFMKNPRQQDVLHLICRGGT